MTKRYFLGFLCLVAWVNTLQAQTQTTTIEIDAGLLKNSTGTATVPVGGLLELIASPSGIFSAPTSSSYVTGDNVLVASFAMNNGGCVAGETDNEFNGLALSTSSYTITPGEELLLRFYFSLTAASPPSAPTLGTTYGQVRSNTIEFGAAGGVPTETAWVVPSAGNSADFEYITQNDGGSYGNTTAYATDVVLMNVPEPPAAVFQGGLALGLLAWTLRQRGAREMKSLSM